MTTSTKDTIAPKIDAQENIRTIQAALRSHGCFETAKCLSSCMMEWKNNSGYSWKGGSYTLVFAFEVKPTLLLTRARDLWKAVKEVTKPTLVVTDVIVRTGDGKVIEERVSILENANEIIKALTDHCTRRKSDEAISLLKNMRIGIGWDPIDQEPCIRFLVSPDIYCIVEAMDNECYVDDNFDWVGKSPMRDIRDALHGILGNGVSVRFCVDGERDSHSETGLNNCYFRTEKTQVHDELRFRSPAEIAIYDELTRRQVLFFPNAAAVLGGPKHLKREPDFLVCDKGKWGMLEVNGATYHTNAAKDHDRARLFKSHGVLCYEFFDAQRCMSDPKGVVDAFLEILAKH